MSDFARICEMLTSLGVEYSTDYEYRGTLEEGRKSHDVPIITGIKLPFSNNEWVHLCCRDGDYYLGGCCGTLSALQDELNHIFRFDMFHTTYAQLDAINDYLVSHGDSEWWTKTGDVEDIFAEAMSKGDKLEHPLEKAAYIYAIAKEHMKKESAPTAARADKSEFNKAVHLVSHTASQLGWIHILDKDDSTGQSNANQMLAMARMAPAIKTVHGELSNHFSEFNGFALVEIEHDDPNNVCDNRKGFCIYNTLEDIQEFMTSQQKYHDEYKERIEKRSMFERYAARPVRITIKNGLEFTGNMIRVEKDA